jgi:hypothetical protein
MFASTFYKLVFRIRNQSLGAAGQNNAEDRTTGRLRPASIFSLIWRNKDAIIGARSTIYQTWQGP